MHELAFERFQMKNNAPQNSFEYIQTKFKFSSFQLAMGFAVFALIATLVLAPNSDKIGDKIAGVLPANQNPAIDHTVTGSIKKSATKRYTIRRSVLQKSRESQCVIYSNGIQQGDC